MPSVQGFCCGFFCGSLAMTQQHIITQLQLVERLVDMYNVFLVCP
jgi:hypothetical protein